MPTNKNLYLPRQYRANSVVTLVNSDSTNLKDLISPSGDDCRLIMLSITTSDATARDVLIYLSDTASSGTTASSGDSLIGHIDVPANSGFDGTVNAVNGLNSTNLAFTLIDIAGNRFIPIPVAKKLRIAAKVAVTSGATIWVTAIVEDL